MGIKPIKGINEYTNAEYYYYNNPQLQDFDAIPFYNSWDEIMPVIEKIENFGGDSNEIDIFGNCVQIGDKEFVGKTKIEVVIEAVNWWIKANKI